MHLGHYNDFIHGVVESQPHLRKQGATYRGKVLEIGARCLALNPQRESVHNKIHATRARFHSRFEDMCLGKTVGSDEHGVAMMTEDGN